MKSTKEIISFQSTQSGSSKHMCCFLSVAFIFTRTVFFACLLVYFMCLCSFLRYSSCYWATPLHFFSLSFSFSCSRSSLGWTSFPSPSRFLQANLFTYLHGCRTDIFVDSFFVTGMLTSMLEVGINYIRIEWRSILVRHIQKYMNTRTHTRTRTQANTRTFNQYTHSAKKQTHLNGYAADNTVMWIQWHAFLIRTWYTIIITHLMHTQLPNRPNYRLTHSSHTVFQEWDWENERASESERVSKMEWQKNRTNYTLTSLACVCACIESRSQRVNPTKTQNQIATEHIKNYFLLRRRHRRCRRRRRFLFNSCCCCCCCWTIAAAAAADSAALYSSMCYISSHILYLFILSLIFLLCLLCLYAAAVTCGQFFFLSSKFSPFNFNFNIGEVGFPANHTII